MKDIKVAITGVGGAVAIGAIKALENSGLPIQFYLMCIDPRSAWLYRYPNSTISPRVDSPKYINFLLQHLKQNAIDVLIPTIDSEIELVAKHADRIREATGCKIFVNSIESTAITQDKYQTYEFLMSEDFSTPRTYLFDEYFETSEIQFPCLLKPKRGAGSKGISLVQTVAELEYFQRDSNYIIQEFISGDFQELTCGVYLSSSEEVMGVSVLSRELRNGSTMFAERIINLDIEAEVIQIAQALKTRYLNVQAKYDGKRLYVFELNGRLSGTTSIVSRIFNAPAMFIREEVLHEPISRVESNETFIALRYQDEIFINRIDYDTMLDKEHLL